MVTCILWESKRDFANCGDQCRRMVSSSWKQDIVRIQRITAIQIDQLSVSNWSAIEIGFYSDVWVSGRHFSKESSKLA